MATNTPSTNNRTVGAIASARPVGREQPALRTAAYRELYGEGGPLLDFSPEFNAPEGWSNQVHQSNQFISDAQRAGPGPSVTNENGLPAEWYYKTANATDRLGPHGDALPSQALGWLPTGEPDFGGGMGGVLKRSWYHLYEKPREDITTRDLGAFGDTATQLRQQLDELDLDFETQAEASASFLRATPVVLGSAFQYLKDLWAAREDNETISGKVAQFIGAGIRLVGDTLQESAFAVRNEIIGPSVLASDELIRRTNPAEAAWLDKFRPLGALSVLAPYAVAAKLRLQDIITEAQYDEARDRNKDAARMAYTAWFDPAAREEYIRRLREGDDPRLLALELQNPGAESAGLVIYDPLNALDFLQVGSKLRSLSRIRTAKRQGTIIQYEPLVDALNDFQNATGEAEIPAKARRVLETHGEMIEAARQGNVALAGRRGLLSFTAGGKRSVISQRVNNFMATIIGASGQDVDLANSTWKGLVLSADVNPARRAEGLSILNQVIKDSRGSIPSNILFSNDGNQTAILLRNLMLDDAGNLNLNVMTNMIEEAGNDPVKLAELLEAKLNKAMESQFPTIQQQVAAYDKYTELAQTDDAAAAQFLERNPLATRRPNEFWRGLASIDEVAQKYFYRPAGELQSRLFMGTAPASFAYRMTNRWGNFVPTFVDLGPDAAIKGLFGVSPRNALDRTAQMLGGVIPEGALRGIGPGASFRDAKKAGDGLDKFFTAGLRGAAKDEAANAAFVVEKSVSRTMGSALKAERRIINQELARLPIEQRRLVANAMRQTWGNVDNVIDSLRSEDGYDVARNLGFLNDEEVTKLQDLRLYDSALAAARENDNLDDILRRLDDLKDQYRQVGRGSGTEPVIFAMDDEWGQSMAQEAHAIEQQEGLDAANVFQRQRHEAREVDRLFEEAVLSDRGLKRLAQEQLLRTALAEARALGKSDDEVIRIALAQLDGIVGPIETDILDATRRVFEDSDAFLSETWRLSDDSRGRRVGDPWLTRKWNERELGEIPQGLTPKQFRDALWRKENYRDIQNARWTDFRDANVQRYRVAANRLASAAGIQDANTPLMNAAQAQLVRSRLMDRAVLLPDGRMAVEFAKTPEGITDLINSLARHLGVTVNPEVNVGLLDRVDDLTGQPTLGLLAIDPAPGGGSVITLTDEFLNQNIAGISENLAHEIAHLLEDTPEGGRVLSELYGGSYEDFVRDILYETGLQRNRAVPSAERSEAIRQMLEANPDISTPINVLRDLEDAPDGLRLPVSGSADDAVPSPNRVFHETSPVASDAIDQLKNGIRENWGRTERGALDPETERLLRDYSVGARQRMTEARSIAINVANQARDFILHNYGKRYGLDLVAGYIWPYQFWHSRTYMKWMSRFIEHPGLLAAYAKYRQALAEQHAGMPEWWKYNINVTELLGIESDHPLWFNLERTLNPINGLTDVNFTDPRRRLDMWSATVEDLNKFGPSVWMPFQVALALKYHMQGEDDAAARWAGRLWSPTRLIRDVTALLDPKGLGTDIDPFINFFSGGLDPHERGRVGRQLSAMQEEGRYDPADIVDSAYQQSGPIWDEARARAINLRAPNLPLILAPFFLGSGFKARTESDIRIDEFNTAMIGLIRNKPGLSPEEYRRAWFELEQRYPFMDALLLSRKSGPDRDEALVWSVLDRIPPAMSDDLAELVGLDPDLLGRFHDTKGNLDDMTEADRLQFLGGIMQLAAILDVPDGATRAEWTAASGLYQQMRVAGEQKFGDDIWERVDNYFGVYDPEDTRAADAFLKAYPIVSEALDWQQYMVMSTPLLGAYYTSAERIRKFYKRQMYETAEGLYGEDLFDHFDVWSRLRDAGERQAAKRYWDDHPQLRAYVEFRDSQLPLIDARVDQIANLLPEAAPPQFRGETPQDFSEAQEPSYSEWVDRQFASYATGERDIREPVSQEAQQASINLTPTLYRLYQDYLNGEILPPAVRDALEAAGINIP